MHQMALALVAGAGARPAPLHVCIGSGRPGGAATLSQPFGSRPRPAGIITGRLPWRPEHCSRGRMAAASSAEGTEGDSDDEAPPSSSSSSGGAGNRGTAANRYKKRGGTANKQDHRVFVSGLPTFVEWPDVEAHFADAGDVVYVKMPAGKEGAGTGTALVTYRTAQDARVAQQILDGSDLGGSVLRVGPDKLTGRREGDWECTCGVLVFSYRQACVACGATRPQEAKAARRRRFGEKREGDWRCTGCREMVYDWRIKCPFCGDNKRATGIPKAAEWRPGDWKCPGCRAHVFSFRDECQCGEKRPAGLVDSV